MPRGVAARYRAPVLILAILGAGMLTGGLAQLVLGLRGHRIDWTLALLAGIGGSFVGGLLFSLLSGNGFDITVSGLIGSFVGALIITALWQWYDRKRRAEASAAALHAKRSGRHH